ncbi:uncharacterized protein N7484_007774 [Penicillium longicatenatum]|uniref:uncharacterized protein n=1 Tax=Penicillium longicatenatum TaxID=1561947 RepID=UPI0025472A48|nr:uncharacterized protein N7484_007774 [Penicillium longicatenatum]KAJ5639912.1 hypothetical protein N7484_007774 [Penicillium longicatenatum]
MKLYIIPLALLATSAIGARVTQSEADDWHQCMESGLKRVDNGKDDSGTTCALLECLASNAEEYHRGGMYGSLAGIVDAACVARKIPFIGGLIK